MTTPDSLICAPGVGRFFPRNCAAYARGRRCVGILLRLGERIPVLAQASDGAIEYLVRAGEEVAFGQPLGRLVHRTTPAESVPEHTTTYVPAPADGFLRCVTDADEPLKKSGEAVARGDVIAFLEFMKIRMDILYDGPEDAVFVRYIGSLNRSVQKGELIAECGKIPM